PYQECPHPHRPAIDVDAVPFPLPQPIQVGMDLKERQLALLDGQPLDQDLLGPVSRVSLLPANLSHSALTEMVRGGAVSRLIPSTLYSVAQLSSIKYAAKRSSSLSTEGGEVSRHHRRVARDTGGREQSSR
ncbi:hypothetical protein LTR53_019534, partial [Teratosphaeriaceae sp. CCFEE 6253]